MQTKPLFLALFTGLSFSGAAQAALIDRGGGLIYDDVLNVTWLQNANLAATETFGVNGINADGTMNWNIAHSWLDAMNATSYLDYNNWRMPTLSPLDGIEFNMALSYDGNTDYSYNNTSKSSELAYMFYVNLGNEGSFDNSAGPTECNKASISCLTYTGPFDNLELSDLDTFYLYGSIYWFGVEYEYNPTSAWGFNMYEGVPNHPYKLDPFRVWAVRDGDISLSSVPEPGTGKLILFGAGLLLFGHYWRRKMCCTKN